MQERVDSGQLAARSAYELSKLANESAQRNLAAQAASGKLTHKHAVAAVRQQKGKPPTKRGFKQAFFADNGFRVTVSSSSKGTYDDVELALSQALDEVRHYISQGRRAF